MKTYQILILLICISLLSCRQNKSEQAVVKKSILDTTVTATTIRTADTLIFKDAGLTALVKHAEKLFSVFDTISPFGEYDIRKFKLNKYDIDTLYKYNSDTIPHSSTIQGFEATGILSGMICDDLEKILKWKNIDDYDLSLLLKNHLVVAKSPDGKLYCFAFEARTGGSYQSLIRYIHYNISNNKSLTISDPDENNPTGQNDIFNTDGYNAIDTIHTRQGIKYLLTGSVIGCNTCMGYYIDLVHFEKGKFIKDFTYSVGVRDGGEIINYNAKQHLIHINYNTDDLTPTCNCGKNGSIDEDSKEQDNRTGDVTCIYKFNGKSFVLKNKRVRRIRD